MKQAKELVEALRKVIGDSDAVFPAIVESVSKEDSTCEINFNGLELGAVRIRATIKKNATGCRIYPAENSVVLVQRLGKKGELFIILVSEVDEVIYEVNNKILFKHDTTEIEISDKISIKHENETLKKIMNDLIAEVKKIVVPTNVGPSGTPINAAAFEAINTRVNNLLK